MGKLYGTCNSVLQHLGQSELTTCVAG
jgi:hypothetical protein